MMDDVVVYGIDDVKGLFHGFTKKSARNQCTLSHCLL